MPLTLIVLVSVSLIKSNFRPSSYPSEVAVSLNTNEAQILSHNGAEWMPTETLSEVDLYQILL